MIQKNISKIAEMERQSPEGHDKWEKQKGHP